MAMSIARWCESPRICSGLSVVAEKLGVVRAANVISTLVSFSPVVQRTGAKIAPGVVMPHSTEGYGYVYHHPDQRGDAARDVGAGALVDVDIAFELIIEKCPSVVVYTSVLWVRTSLEGPPRDEEWVRLGAYRRRPIA